MIKEHVPEIMISHGISRKWIGILIVRKEDTTKEVVRKNHFRFSSFGNFVMKTIYQRDTYIYNIVCKQIYTITMLRHSFLVSKLPNVSPPSLVIMESLDATVESFCRLISFVTYRIKEPIFHLRIIWSKNKYSWMIFVDFTQKFSNFLFAVVTDHYHTHRHHVWSCRPLLSLRSCTFYKSGKGFFVGHLQAWMTNKSTIRKNRSLFYVNKWCNDDSTEFRKQPFCLRLIMYTNK